jgi:hypothetical protein
VSTRHIRCECAHCGTIFRMASKHIDRAHRLGGLRCPVCVAPATTDAGELSDEDRELIAQILDRNVADIARAMNADEERRRRAMCARGRRNAGVYTGAGVMS